MDQIRSYIEAMFSSLPKTKEAIEMKLNILDHSEEKYNELIAAGKNNYEAVGIIISDFGSIEELKRELGIEMREEVNKNKAASDYTKQQEEDTLKEDLGAKTNKYDRNEWKKGGKHDALNGVIWSVTVIIFLIIGFAFGLWHPGWLVFLVAAAIIKIIDYYTKENTKK